MLSFARMRPRSAEAGRRQTPGRGRTPFAAALLALAVLVAFGGVLRNDFLTWDDPEYVTANPAVRAGPTPRGLAWAATATEAHNWHPATWVSHMIDAAVFGLRPAGHHATSLLLHVAGTLLLYRFLVRTTGAPARSAFAAAFFAAHPLRVESVAWISQRKDVLAFFFLAATLVAYARWAERRSAGRLALAISAAALGLLSKPTLVTLPLLLLLLDFWPLERRRGPAGSGDRPGIPRLLIEKIPFAALAAVSAVLTWRAQRAGGAVQTLESFPLGARVGNAAVSCVAYLRDTVWPVGLSPLHPHPGPDLAVWKPALAALGLLAVTVLLVRLRRARPELLVGWLWYLVALAPMSGIVQVGEQARADRYAYVPSIGLAILAAWGIPEALSRIRAPSRQALGPRAIRIGGVLAVAALVAVSSVQTAYWRDTETLFGRALEIDPGNPGAHRILGDHHALAGDLERAEEEFRAALRSRPEGGGLLSNLGGVLVGRGGLEEAVDVLRRSVRIDPRSGAARNNLGLACAALGRLDAAEAEFEAAIALRPGEASAHYNLGNTLARQGRFPEAAVSFRRAIGLDPGTKDAYRSLAWALLLAGDAEGAREAVRAGRTRGFEPPRDLLEALDGGR